MKKVLVFLLALMMLVAMTGCTQDQAAATATPEVSADQTAASTEWSVKIGDFDVISSMVGNSVDTVTQTLEKVSKDGSMKDQECKGYKVSELLTLAGVDECTTVTVVAADGYEYEMTSDEAMLDTTMLVIEQDGEAYDVPRFAVDGAGSAAWVKDVVELRITE